MTEFENWLKNRIKYMLWSLGLTVAALIVYTIWKKAEEKI